MAESFHTNLISISTAFIKEAGLKITASSLKENLTQNPYYPSLYSLSEIFTRFHIENKAIRVSIEDIDNLRVPFIAYMAAQTTGKDFVTVTSVKSDRVICFAEGKRCKTIKRVEFDKNWLGIVLLAEPDEKSGEENYEGKRKKEIIQQIRSKTIIAGSCAIAILIIFYFLHSLQASLIKAAFLLLLIKSIGIIVTVLLLIFEIDQSNTFIKNICTAGKQTNCEAILNSKASKTFGISWSEVGFFYFATTLLFLLIPGFDFLSKATVISVANLAAVPYVFFSIYYQWKVARQWCPLCLTVQVVLIAELLWGVKYIWMNLSSLPSWNILPALLGCLALPVIVWNVLKPILNKAKDTSLFEAAYKRLLYDPETFQHLLSQQAIAPDGYQHIGITIGNLQAKNTIIKVCNPYCAPCARAHPVLDEIIRNNPHVKLKLIFAATNGKNDIRGIVARHLLAISKRQPEKTEQALDDWYLAKKTNYEAFAKKYNLNGELEEQKDEIEAMVAWCKDADISFTPTIYLNGHRLPQKYGVEELKFVL